VKVAAEKEPVASVVVVPLNVTAEPPKVPVTVLEAAKPVPETVMIEPTVPLVGLKVIDGFTVKDEVCELPLPSVALVVSEPTGAWGTTNVAAEKEPVELVTMIGDVVTDVPTKVIPTGELAAKPVPETVTVDPQVPLDGLVTRVGVTVKLA